ncbi:MAG TPA: regulatory protein RecX [Steroidobacteraceae bacterium]|nr:regulatory protein RecX [Steroidobacteraceae bacterium]
MARKPALAGDPHAIRAAALTLLARRDWLTGELSTKLQASGADGQATAAVIAELLEERLLNDTRYAERYVVSRAERGQGPLRIAADLGSLGASRELIEAAIASGPDWRAVAAAVRRRKFGAAPPDSWAEKARQARFLQYRGFSSDHIRAATGADLEPD